MTLPHLGQPMGWRAPRGAPQASQLAAPTLLAVSQYGQLRLLSRSEISLVALDARAYFSTASQTFCSRVSEVMSCARSSRRLRIFHGFIRADRAVWPSEAATPSHSCWPV